GQVLRPDGAVLVGAPDHQHPADAGGGAGHQDVERALGVDPEHLQRRLPRRPDVGHGGEVVDGGGPVAADDVADSGRVGDVRPGDVVDPGDLVPGRFEVGDEGPADEPAGPGDE